MSSTTSIFYLPDELLGHTLSFLTPKQIHAFGLTCRKFASFIAPTNTILWRLVFVSEFDDPHRRWDAMPLPMAQEATETRRQSWNWYGELKGRFLALHQVDGFAPVGESNQFYGKVAGVLLDILDTAILTPVRESRNIAKLIGTFSERLESFIDSSFISQEPIYDVIRGGPEPASRRHYTRAFAVQNKIPRPDSICRLHVLYGPTFRERRQEAVGTRSDARQLVYDWHLTGLASDYGPYCLDGSGKTNWPLLEAANIIISRNLGHLIVNFPGLKVPQDLRYSLPYRTTPDSDLMVDWAGVTGIWVGTYSFIDYEDLFRYNVGYERGRRLVLHDEMEACGDLMRLELNLDDKIKRDPKLDSKLPTCKDLPAIYFSGTSCSHASPQGPQINVRGRVSLVPGGKEVRWRYLISYGGIDQWQLEGVQAGGVRSAGVVGLWSHCGHEEHGPVGPFCYYPFSLCESRPALGTEPLT